MQINPKRVIERGIVQQVKNQDEQVQQVGIDLTLAQDVTLKPLSFANVEVQEKFNMQDTFGLIVIRSSFSRKGIFTTSGVYDPGFNGRGGVSIYNMGDKVVHMMQGERIGQMIIFKADPASMYNGFYNKTNEVSSQYDRKTQNE